MILSIHNIFHRLWAKIRPLRLPLESMDWLSNEGLFAGFVVAVGHVGKTGGIVQECQVEAADGTVALFGDDDLSFASEGWIVLFVNLFAEDKHDEVGVLLDGAGLTQIGKLGPMVAAATF